MEFELLIILLGILICAVALGENKEILETPSSSSTTKSSLVQDDSDMYMETSEGTSDHQPASSSFDTGSWFPSFARSYDPYYDHHPPSGHSRPVFHDIYHQQEGAYSQKNEPFQQDVTYNHAKNNNKPYGNNNKEHKSSQPSQASTTKENAASILGDGNFGIIRGGTFYPEKDGYGDSDGGFDDYSSYFHNGHGRPSYFYPTNPKPVKHQQFENFRDFADINNPNPERQYSQYVVVYTNKNGTRISTIPSSSSDENLKGPKNILESLTLLDAGSEEMEKNQHHAVNQGDILELVPEKKLSKSKRKLAKLLSEKKHEARLQQKSKDFAEPLLALS